MTLQKWLHIEELGSDTWLSPICAALNDAIREGRTEQLPDETYELGLWITTRLNILPHVVSRTNEGVQQVFQQCKNPGSECISTPEYEGCSFRLEGDVKYQLIIRPFANSTSASRSLEMISSI